MARKPSRIPPHAIRPIIEFYPLTKTATSHGVKWNILDPKSQRMKLVRVELKAAHGIYVFYNSQCHAIYVGKANKLSLWRELKNAFNRKREAQIVWKVKHPLTGNSFIPAYIIKRRIKKRHVYLHEIASFLSVYEVGDRLIDNLEAILLRTFPNELSNAKMESISYDKT
jgi:hypothetical protein